MKTNCTIYYSFLLVLLIHAGALALMVLTPVQSKAIEVVPPTIQGVIISVEPPQPPSEPLPLPSPEQKPLPKPRMPVPKAPASERAIQQQPEVETVRIEQKPTEPSAAPPSPEQLVLPHVDANQINNPAPVYPAISRRLREEGVVVLEVLVLASGGVGELRLKSSSGYSRLDETAMRAVKSWHFVPAMRGDQAIDFWYELPIDFALNK